MVHEWSFESATPLVDTVGGAVRGVLRGAASVERGRLRVRESEDMFVVDRASLSGAVPGKTLMAWIALVDPFSNVSNVGATAGATVWRVASLDGLESDALALLRVGGRTLLYAASAHRERSLPQSTDVPLTASAPHLIHVAAVFDDAAPGNVALYLDGQLYKPVYGEASAPVARFAAGAVLAIGGAERDGAALPLAFDVARVRVYDEALPATDVRLAFFAHRCSNGLLDAGESGVDCGAPCVECVDRCANNVRDGDESDVDCGGTRCRRCADVRDEQRAVLQRYAATDARHAAAALVLGGNGGLSSRLTVSLARGRGELLGVRVVALSGATNADAVGACGAARAWSALVGERGFEFASARYHAATRQCGHAWADSNERASVTFDLGVAMQLDELRVWNWNVGNETELGARILDIDVAVDDVARLMPYRPRVLLLRAPGVADAAFEQRITLVNATARFVRLRNMVDWRNRAGGALSKVRFVGRPVDATRQVPRTGGLAALADGSGVGVSDGAHVRAFVDGDVVRLAFSAPSTLTRVVAAGVERSGDASVRTPFALLTCDQLPERELTLADSLLYGVSDVSDCTLRATSAATFALSELRWRTADSAVVDE